MENNTWVEPQVDESLLSHPNDKLYIVNNIKAKMKLPDSNKWVDAVIYTGKNVYVREKTDFMKCFKKLEYWRNIENED